jgi:predicted transcriptional regulator of viral defense system
MRRDPLDLRRALARVARQQGGYFSAGQALQVGYSYPSQRYHTARGDWLRVDRGIYRLPDWPATQHEDLVRWSLWSRGRGVVSHDTALAVHELGDVMPARVHLTVPPGFRSRSPAVTLHVAALDEAEVERFEGFAVTTPLRSSLDAAAGGLEVDRLARVLEDALDRGLVTVGQLRGAADRFGPAAALAVERALRQVGR